MPKAERGAGSASWGSTSCISSGFSPPSPSPSPSPLLPLSVFLFLRLSFCFLVSPIHSGSSFPPRKFSVHFVFCPLLVLSSMHQLPLPRLFSFYFFCLPLYFNKSYPVHLSHSSLFLSCFFFPPYLSHKVSRTPHTQLFYLMY